MDFIRQQAIELFFHHRVALAYPLLKLRTIQHGDVPAAVVNQAVRLQVAGRLGHALPAHAQHIRDQLLRHQQFIASQTVQAQQQPAA
jgi:chromosome condensin MukBEF complex kleisin-like MukF subunit